MKESYGFEARPVLAERELSVDTLSPSVTEMPESYPVPAIIENTEPNQSLEIVQETYDQVFEAPIKEQQAQLEKTQAESQELTTTVDTLEASLPEALAGADGEKVRSLVTQLNDIDRRRIGLIQQRVYMENEVQFQKKEAATFQAERDRIVEQLIELIAEILNQARTELGRLKGTVEATHFQMGFSREEQQQTLSELASLEAQFVSFKETQGDDLDLVATFDTALEKITTARTDIVKQQHEQAGALLASEAEALMIEDKVTGYESEMETLRGQLMIEDQREAGEVEEVALEAESPEVDDSFTPKDITDAEFEPIVGEEVAHEPTENLNIEIVGRES